MKSSLGISRALHPIPTLVPILKLDLILYPPNPDLSLESELGAIPKPKLELEPDSTLKPNVELDLVLKSTMTLFRKPNLGPCLKTILKHEN